MNRGRGAPGPASLSADLLRAVRRSDPTAEHESALRSLDPAAVASLDGAGKTAFWLNVYNAFVQLALEADARRYEHRWRFFRRDRVPVAGRTFSLDDVEHGMLRRSQFKYGLGYVPNPFPGEFERRLRVEALDPRIHFALNCGAASCPPIAVYTPDGLDDELALATASYLETEVTYDPDAGVVSVPRLFLWFRGDFGGKSGILELLSNHGCLPDGATPRLSHQSYDWSLSVGDYADRSVVGGDRR